MKIGIDASRAFLSEKTGTENYSHELIGRLCQIVDSENQFFLYVRKGANIDFTLPRNFFVREIGGIFLWTQLRLSREMLRNKIDVLFVPSHSVPFIHPAKTVVTIHGLEYKAVPGCYSLKARVIMKINTRLSLLWASKIIVPSENTKSDLMRFYKVDPAKIRVISHGTERQLPSQEMSHANEFNLLFIGRLEKRKNIIGIIRAFETFMEYIPQNNEVKIRLRLAGGRGYGFDEIEKAILASKNKKNITLCGYVDESAKKALYENADIFLFPSLYEGFGLPVLEAMSYGVTVICSNSSSLVEIAGDAAMLVDPFSTDEISAAINAFFQNKEKRRKYGQKGYKNLEKFSWEKCATETLSELSKW